jgi:hypothetical protein
MFQNLVSYFKASECHRKKVKAQPVPFHPVRVCSITFATPSQFAAKAFPRCSTTGRM